MESSAFLAALTLVLGVAAITTLVFHKLRQPVVLGYILAGVIIGPHVPIPVAADPSTVQTLSELGVILLMFGLGLEFSLGKLFRAAPTAGVTALIQCSVMMWLGFAAGKALGWTTLESIFTGAIVAVSSTTIIAKAFDEQKIGGRLRELVVAILIVEDLIAVVLMAVLTGVASGTGLTASELGVTLGRLGAFLALLVIGGLVIVPRFMRWVVAQGRDETTVIAAIGVCFAISLLCHALDYSVALGAFVAGVLVSESGEAPKIARLVDPVRDLFAAVFFVSVGMLIDPRMIVEHWAAVVVLTTVVVVGKIGSVALGAFLTGNGTRISVAAGMSLAQIGEFSFIIAGLGLALGATGKFIYPIAVAVSAITTLITPWLIRASDTTANFVDRKLPRRMQTFVAFYESWIERLRAGSGRGASRSRIRRLLRVVVIDGVVVAVVAIGVSLAHDRLVAALADAFELEPLAARVIVVGVAVAIALPFCASIIRTTRRLAATLAEIAVPRSPDDASADLGRASRTALEATLAFAGVLIAGLPLIALTQPFLPGFTGAAALGLALIALAIGFWRTAADLHGHVRAAAQVIVEALAAGTRETAHTDEDPLGVANALLPGLGDAVRVEISPRSRAVGKSLAQLELRGHTGATVLAITRGEGGIAIPDAHEALRAGDVLAITGSQLAIASAIELLGSDTTSTTSEPAGG